MADGFLAAYEVAAGVSVGDVSRWDGWALSRSHTDVETWEPNYAPLGRPDLDPGELRHRHDRWTARLLDRG